MLGTAIILVSESSIDLANTIARGIDGSKIYAKTSIDGVVKIHSIPEVVSDLFDKVDSFIFIGAMGICVRSIAPYIKDKHTDPAVVNVDSTGKYIVSVLSGHVGGANELTKQVAHLIGGEAIVTTQSDNTNLWALDTIGKQYGWVTETTSDNLNHPITLFVNAKPTALLLDVRDSGTAYLERTAPEHVSIYYSYNNINFSRYELLLAVTPFLYPEVKIPVVCYHPKVLSMGVGCRKNCSSDGVVSYIKDALLKNNIAEASVKAVATIDIKKDEWLVESVRSYFSAQALKAYAAEELKGIEVPNPSEKVERVTGVGSVSEAAAIKSSDGGVLILEKQKGAIATGNEFTFAVAIDSSAVRKGHVEIVGAGPGDPELVSVRGKHFLEAADLILYAGSLVPIELTYYAKQGAVVRSSADMTLEEQFELMKSFYDKGLLVVRLHTGDPCIYGAIQEQMAFFDEYNMSYHITPGISSFQAAAAALRSQFTIPEKVQTIILTRGEGRTPMPEKEQLHLLARSQSTMCIFLSAGIVDKVQQELLEHYPPETPVAACYKLTWKDEKIYRGQLKDLAKIVKENNLTLTTMIVVGDAIDNRQGLSKLYSHQFKHLFRK